mgnify:CR=1 FL=1
MTEVQACAHPSYRALRLKAGNERAEGIENQSPKSERKVDGDEGSKSLPFGPWMVANGRRTRKEVKGPANHAERSRLKVKAQKQRESKPSPSGMKKHTQMLDWMKATSGKERRRDNRKKDQGMETAEQILGQGSCFKAL